MIRPKIIEFGKTTAVYGLGNILNKTTAFLLIPIYVKYLSLSEVGSIALIELLESFLILFLLSGLIQSIWKRLKNANQIEKNKIVFSAWVGLLFITFILFLILYKYKHYLALFLGLNSPEISSLVPWILLGIFCQIGGQFLLFQLQFESRPISYITFSIFQLILTLGFTIYFTVFEKMGLHGIIYAKVIVTTLAFIFSSIYLTKKYFCIPSITVFRKLIIFGIPLIFLGLATPILTLSDRFFLNMFVPLSMIGIYSINYKFGMLINMILVVPLQRGLLPMIYKQGLKDEMQPIYKDTLFYYSVIGCFIILGITFFIKPIIGWISSPDYLEAAYVVPFVAAAYLIAGFRPFFTPLVALKDRTDLLGKAAFVGIAVCLSLNFLLIKNYGINGAVAATVISYAIFTYSVYYLSKKVEPMEWNWPRIANVVLLTTGIIAGVHIAGTKWNGLEPVFGLIGLVSFPILLWAFRIIGEREINGVKSIISFVQNKMRIK